MLSDAALEKIGVQLLMEPMEIEHFIATIRQGQNEIFIKSFLIYYESYKSESEKRYLEIIGKRMEEDGELGIKMLVELINKESSNNPEVGAFIKERMLKHDVSILSAYSKGKSHEQIREVLVANFPYQETIDELVEQGKLEQPEEVKKLIAKINEIP
ncbi:MAG: hypothetical protein ACOCXP_03660 [Candidatus Dojkabacteria bacterium]